MSETSKFDPGRFFAGPSRRWLFVFILLSSFVIRHSSFAGPLTAQLVSEVASVQPGKPFHVGLQLTHRSGYHTYWKFPGIVGVPTSMIWELPPGWKAGPIEWPAPKRVMMFQIKAQGYHDEVMLLMQLTPPKNLIPGTKVTLKGKSAWMCCGRECNPDFAELSITLPVDGAAAPLDGRWQKQFAKSRASMPTPLAGFDATARRSGDTVVLKLSPKPGQENAARLEKIHNLVERKGNYLQRLFGSDKPDDSSKKGGDKAPAPNTTAGVFFTEDGYINADMDQAYRMEGDALVIELKISTYFVETPPGELRGILWLKDDLLGKGVIIRAPFGK